MASSSSSPKLESTPVSFYGLALRLRRGASEIVSWSADRGSLEGTLRIGSDPSCDWTVRGPGIAPFELSVRAPEGRLEVQSARPGMGAKLDGEVLGSDWVSLEPGSRLEFGFACIALEFDAAPLTGVAAHEQEVPLAFLGTPLPPPDLSVQAQAPAKEPAARSEEPKRAEPAPTPRSKASAPKSPTPAEPPPHTISGNSAIITQHMALESLLRALEQKAEQLRSVAARAISSTGQRLSAASARLKSTTTAFRSTCAQAVARLTRPRTSRPPARPRGPMPRRIKVLGYALLAVLTLCAYGYWILWLDRI